MARGRDLEALVRRFDRELAGIENATVRSLKRALRESQTRLEAEVRRLYTAAVSETAGAGAALAEARARLLLEQVRAALQLLRGVPVETVMANLARDAYDAGAANATAALSASQLRVVALTATVRVDVAVRAANAAARLAHHGAEFASAAERLIIDGIVRGRSWGATARELRRATGATAARAETIIRTESLIASDTARRDTYAANGVEYVQRMATADNRVCGWCAARAGNVYRVEDAPAALHPNDRCYNAPYRPEWVEMGLADEEWFRAHAAETQRRTEEPLRTGPAPFEKAEGREPPQPVWTP